MHRKHRQVLIAALSVVAMVATACSSADDGEEGSAEGTSESSAETTPDTDGGTTPDSAAGTTPDSAAGTTPDSAAGTTPGSDGGTEGQTPLTPPGENHVTDDEGEPVSGGTLVYGIEADSANAWAPYAVSCATACYVMLASVSDPLFYWTPEGELAPMLVESWEPNEDYTEWTYQIREGITFHDGTPLTGAAVEFNLEACQYAPLTAAAYAPVESVSSEGQTVTVTYRGRNVVGPGTAPERQCGYMFSPEWLRSLPDVPQRQEGTPVYDAELAQTPADGDPAKPVGLGAFVFESYRPGNGNAFRLTRNEDYWRGENGITGENLPYLDAIEGVVAVDIQSRSNGLRSGQFNIIHTSNPDSIAQLLEDDALEVTATSRYGDTNHIMLNVAEGEVDPQGQNADSPLLNVHCRRALAHATDQERLIEERAAGLTLPANGPFTPGQLGYLEDTGYPEYNPEMANEELETCLQELGQDSIQFEFNTTNDPFNVQTNSLIISMWQEVLGERVQADIAPIEQGQYIGLALTGDFEAFAWRNFGAVDPYALWYWWASSSAAPIGELALNFNRFTDPVIDEAINVLGTNPDPAARKKAAEQISRQFGEQVYNIWTSWSLWGVISQPYVNGVEANTLPDGGEGVGLAFSGRHMTNQLWCNEGACE